jgi:hypothetical protein
MRPPFRSVVLALSATGFTAPAIRAAQDEDAGTAFLRVCNKGTRTVSTVQGVQDLDLMTDTLTVVGWVQIAPGECQNVYEHNRSATMPDPADLGFALFEPDGRFVPAVLTTVPDIGAWRQRSVYAQMRFSAQSGPALTRAAKQLCVHEPAMEYEVHSKSPIPCEAFHADGDSGPFLPLLARLFFHPSGRHGSTYTGEMRCGGGHYYLDVAPQHGSPDLSATWGTVPIGDEAPRVVTPEECAKEGAENVKMVADMFKALRGGGKPTEPKPKVDPVAAKAAGLAYRRSDSLTWVETWNARRASAKDFDGSWIKQKMVIRGTVSRVEIKSGTPSGVYLYFTESPDGSVVACSPSPNLLKGMFELDDLQSLVGKSLDFAGQVESYVCSKGATLRIVDRNQARLVASR